MEIRPTLFHRDRTRRLIFPKTTRKNGPPSLDARKNMSLAQSVRFSKKMEREKISNSLKGKVTWMNGKKAKKITREKMSLSAKRRKPNRIGKLHTEETKKKISCTRKKQWLDPIYCRKVAKGATIKPNKSEIILQSILNEIFPGEWKYTGDFSVWFGGKNPDFMNINGKKKLIELFGDYWHRGENPKYRINHFRQFGFDTLVIWEKELKEYSGLREKIKLFVESNNVY